MAYIDVDHSKFEPAASAVDDYVQIIKRNTKYGDDAVRELASYWEGRDYARFQAKWDQVDKSGSTMDQMVKAFENYAKFLRFAGSKYKKAQIDAVNRANWLNFL